MHRHLETKGGVPIAFLYVHFSTFYLRMLCSGLASPAEFSGIVSGAIRCFADAVPCPDIARLNGALNLAAHLPINGPFADLGNYPLETGPVA